MDDLMQLQNLIDNASQLAAAVDEKEAAVDKATAALRDASKLAKESWNRVYTALLKLAEDRINADDDSFKGSALGYMLKAELEKARRK